MRISVRTKQVAGVSSIVFAVVALLGGYYVLSLAGLLIGETRTRTELIVESIYNMIAHLSQDGGDLATAITTDGGLRTTLESASSFPYTQYAAVVDRDGVALAHNDPTRLGTPLVPAEDLALLGEGSPWQQVRAIYSSGLTREVRLPLLLDSGSGVEAFGEIRVGISIMLLRHELERALRSALLTALALLVGAVLVAIVLAQWLLRPILLLRAGLARLGKGETGVTLDFHQEDEFADLGESFNVVSARLTREHQEGLLSKSALSRRLAALGRVSSGIAHEVKNPLNAMRIHLELLRMQATEAPGTHEHITVLRDQMRRLDEVVQGFLTFTRPEQLSITPIAPLALIEDLLPVVEAEAGKTGVTIEVDVPGDLPDIAGDRALLHQALLNLAINACQAMPTGGRLRFTARPAPTSCVRLTVEDTGTGISPEHLDKIFTLYFTTKPEGTGIGLALVYRTISLHDGDIDVQSVPGTGTTFTVTLPESRGPEVP